MKLRDYTELIAWQKAMEFVTEIYKASENFPQRERLRPVARRRRSPAAIRS